MSTRSATEPPEWNLRFGALTEFIIDVPATPGNDPVDEVLSKICWRCCGVSSG